MLHKQACSVAAKNLGDFYSEEEVGQVFSSLQSIEAMAGNIHLVGMG